MMQRLRLSLIAVIALGLVVLGMAHRAPSATDEALVAYAMAGGDLAGLCDSDGDGQPDHAGACPACQITGSADLPGFTGLPVPAVHPVLLTLSVARDLGVTRPALDPGHGLRAPPAV
ncbi:MAG: hypothetical protein E6Q73_04985 [Pseudorhodobacter sp.]|nr:MAG: hypothetical protein E6Q73_04985 [Pseudorhodobacter sp.]